MTNIDQGVFDYIQKLFDIDTMVDVGCGPGGMVYIAKCHGVHAVGVDGDSNVNADITHNFDDGPLDIGPFDLAWSVEFLEHIEEQYLVNVFSLFKNCKYVFCTHNPKPGPWHFNCQPNEYWIDVFTKNGFSYDRSISEQIKVHSTMQREFVKNSGEFYINEGFDHRQRAWLGGSPI